MLVRLHVAEADPDQPADSSGWFTPDPDHGPVEQVWPHMTPEGAEALAEALLEAAAVARAARAGVDTSTAAGVKA